VIYQILGGSVGLTILHTSDWIEQIYVLWEIFAHFSLIFALHYAECAELCQIKGGRRRSNAESSEGR
jgi:hypothetical protein